MKKNKQKKTKEKKKQEKTTPKVDIKEKIEQGWVQTRAIIEILGKPKEGIESMLRDYTKKIRENNNYILLKEDFTEGEQVEGTESLFAAFVEVEFLSKNIEQVVWFCFDYMPSSIEVIEPQEFLHSAKTYTDFLNEVQGKMHEIDLMLKKTWRENQILLQNISTLARNLVAVSLIGGPKTIEELSKLCGIKEEQIKPILESLVQNKILKKKNNKYYREDAGPKK